jgi:hypothetical protein
MLGNISLQYVKNRQFLRGPCVHTHEDHVYGVYIMGMLNLESIENVLVEHLTHERIVTPLPARFHIGFSDSCDLSEYPEMEPTRFSIRIPKYALQKTGLAKLFQEMRSQFDPEDKCMMLNDGDQGVVIEADAAVKHKALIALWQLEIYNFQFTYKYDLATAAAAHV